MLLSAPVVAWAAAQASLGQSPSPHCVSLLRSKPARRSPLDICLLACWLGQRSLTDNFLMALPPEQLLALAKRVGYEKVPVGSFIMREGMESDRVFLMITDMVSVWERSGAAAALAHWTINKKAAANYAAAAGAAANSSSNSVAAVLQLRRLPQRARPPMAFLLPLLPPPLLTAVRCANLRRRKSFLPVPPPRPPRSSRAAVLPAAA